MSKIFWAIWLKITLEPAMTAEVFKQALNGLIVFGVVTWSVEQLAWANLFAGLFLQFLVRQGSTPNPKVITSTDNVVTNGVKK